MIGTTTLPTSMEEANCHVEQSGWISDKIIYNCIKRLLDIAGALAAVTLLSPVFLMVAGLVRLTSPGPVLFRQRRLGLNGCEFWCYKFRTMVVDAEKLLQTDEKLKARFDENYKLRNDPRLTPIGSLLRKTSLDELPQLYNVLNGTMSLIGPRPIVPPEKSKYGEFAAKSLTTKHNVGDAGRPADRLSKSTNAS